MTEKSNVSYKPRRALIGTARGLLGQETMPERKLRVALTEKYGPIFLAQWAISEFIVDFYAPSMGIAIEVDGDSHRRAATKARDELQERTVAEMGGVTLRFRNEAVLEDIGGVLETVHAAVLARFDQRCPKVHQWRMTKKLRRALMAEREACSRE